MLQRGRRLRNRRIDKLIASTRSIQVGSNAVILEVLNRNNYEKWRLRVKTYLLSEDIWDVVEATTKPPNPEKDEAGYKVWTQKNAKALYAIQNSCGPEMFPFISETESAKKAWEALEQEFKVFQGYDENNPDHLVRFKSFIKSVKSGDWDKAKKCLGEIDVRSVVLRTVDGWWDGTITLHVAAWEGHGHIVKELVHLMSQEDLKTKTSLGHTALHHAAEKGHVHVVKELPVLLMGEVKDKDGDTALHIAVQVGKVAAIKQLVLLMREEDLKKKNHDGYTALHLAVNKGDMHLLTAFMTKDEGENNDFERFIPFTTHVTNGDWDKANDCLVEVDDPFNAITARNPKNERMTALHAAAVAGHVHVIKELVSLLKRRQEELELKTAQDFTVFGSGVKLDVGDGVVMEKAKYMVEQYEKTVGRILEMQSSFDDTALHLAAWKGHLNVVKELAPLMRQEGLELKQKNDSMTALHLAIVKGETQVAKELMHWMRSEALEEVDGEGFTPLSRAIESFKDGDLCEIAKIMAGKNDKVFSISSPPYDEIPVVMALRWGKKKSVRYIYSVTPLEALQQFNGSDFICYCLRASNTIDLAWELLQRHPSLAFTQGTKYSPLWKLATMRSAFLSGSRLKFWQRLLYHCISIPQLAQVNVHDISLNVAESKDDHNSKRAFISSEISLFRRFANGLSVFCGIESIYEMKSKHKWILQLLQCMGEATRNNILTPNQLNVVQRSIFEAIAQGHFEFVTQLCKANPKLLIDISDKKRRSIFHVAIENRQKEVYSLIYGLEEEKRSEIASVLVEPEDIMLHYATNLFSLPQFDRLQDSSLQMQRELQWFKEVESVVPPEMHEYRRPSDNLTAREVFTKNHKKLIEDAENSTKGIATSCTVVGALIVTMMFTAAFTVPGGNNGDTGLPLLLHDKFFKVFIILDTISLVSSITSVITFLGMLTSRYAEDDFLKSLPSKMMIGLFTLFFSIVTMMIAFSCALIILLDGEAWIVIPSIMCCGVPAISFIWFLFPFLGKIFISTYGPGIFDKSQKVKPQP